MDYEGLEADYNKYLIKYFSEEVKNKGGRSEAERKEAFLVDYTIL